AVFYLGAGFTALFIPLTLIFIPESPAWLARKQPKGALEKINSTLKRMGHAAITALPTISQDVRKRSIADIFGPTLIVTSLLVAAGYFFHITTFYFVLKWTPKIVANVGGALGGAVLGLLTLRFGVQGLTIAAMLLSTIAVAIFGHSPKDLDMLSF